MGSRRVLAAGVAVLACALAAPGAARAGTFTFTASADAAVSSSAPYSNYGSSTALRAGAFPTWRSYLRFAVSGLGGAKVTRATLRLYPTASSSSGVTVRSAAAGWTEASLTYANAPAPVTGSSDPVSGPASYGSWLAVDVTRLVTAEGTVGLALTRDSSTPLTFAAREAGSSYAPRLVVETQAADTSAPSAPANLAAASVTTSQVSLSWSPSTDNVGVTGYRVFRDGTQIAAPASASYTDASVAAGKTYRYVVYAVDAAGNVSPASSTLAVTTPSPPPPPRPPGSVRTFTFVPILDAYVDASTPTTSYGPAATLRALASPARRSYLRFSVTGLGLAPTKATLRLKLSQPASDFVVSRVADTSWTEAITYSTAPAISSAPTDPHGSAAAPGWVDVDVTPFVSGNGPVSLAITTTAPTEFVAGSSEALGSQPQLVLQTPSVAPDGSLAWPISAAFYYPWFPAAWSQQGYTCGLAPPAGLPPTPSGCFTQYTPSAGFYTLDGLTGDSVIDGHIRALTAAGQEAAISSWWGPGDPTDTRVPRLLSRTHALGSPLKWALYYEAEGYGNPTVAKIQADLAYIANTKRYTADPSYLRVGGQPVLFVYNADDPDCTFGQRWNQANQAFGFHLVFKVIDGYRNCNLGADWHQYAGGVAADFQKGFSYTITPGFWKPGTGSPLLARDPARWASNIASMRAANVHWRLVTTFNEWGEGTSIESAREWASASGYGTYVDALAAPGQ